MNYCQYIPEVNKRPDMALGWMDGLGHGILSSTLKKQQWEINAFHFMFLI